jgi:hypothetical protein
MVDDETTTIRVRRATKERLEAAGTAADSMDDVVTRLLDAAEGKGSARSFRAPRASAAP